MSKPNGWMQEPLGRIAELVMGQSPESKYYSEHEIGLPFLQGCAEFGGRHPKHVVYCSQPKKVAPRNSILFSVRAPVGRLNVADRDYIIGRGLAAILGRNVDQQYLKHFLQYEEASFQNASQGSTFSAINSSELCNWPVSLPRSTTEQSKIAEILSTVDRAIEQTEALIAKQQRIKTGLMQDLLTRGIDEQGNLRSEQTHQFKDSPLGRIPVEWEARTLDTCCDRIVVGLASSTTHAYRTSGVPMIRNQNIRKGFFDDREMLYLDPTFAKSFPNKAARRGDVLTVRTGSNVGDTATVPERYVGSPTFTTLISSPKNDTLDSTFLVYSVLSDIGQSELNRIMVGGGKENLNVGQFVQFRLRLPPLEEQRRSIEMLDAAGSDIESSRRQLEKYKLLKVALMQDLLTGEKRVTPLLDVDVTEDAVHA